MINKDEGQYIYIDLHPFSASFPRSYIGNTPFSGSHDDHMYDLNGIWCTYRTKSVLSESEEIV